MHLKRKGAMASTEIAITVALVVVVVIAAITLFSQNIGKLVAKGGINTMSDVSNKTAFSKFDRNYTKSQIEVQIVGAQGLQMLRRKANNKALEVIEANFNNSNPDGSSIAYLLKIIEIITGEPHLSPYMTTNSDKHCDEIGEYAYHISQSSSALQIDRKKDSEKASPSVNKEVSAVLDSVSIPLDSNNYPTLSVDEKYALIVDITKKLKKLVRRDCLLVYIAEEQNDDLVSKNDASNLSETQQILINIIKESLASIEATYTVAFNSSTVAGKSIGRVTTEGNLGFKDEVITDTEYDSVNKWGLEAIQKIKEAKTDEEACKIFNATMKNEEVLVILKKDTINNAADKLSSSTKNLSKNGLTEAVPIEVLEIQTNEQKPFYKFLNQHMPVISSNVAEFLAPIMADYPIVEDAVEALETVANLVCEAVEVAKEVIEEAVEVVTNTIEKVVESVTNTVEKVVDAVTDTVKKVGKFFKNLFKKKK